MASNSIGTSSLILSVNAIALENGLKRVEGMLQGWKPQLNDISLGGIAKGLGGKMLDGLTSGLAAAGPWGQVASAALTFMRPAIDAISNLLIGSVTGMVDEFQKGFHRAQELVKSGKKVGLGPEEYSGLAFAAASSGQSLEVLNKAIHISSELLYKASGGAADAQAKFAHLGLDWKQLKGMDVAHQIGTVGDALNKFQGGAKIGAATDMFGRKGLEEIMPLLNRGTAGFTAMAERAKRLGITLDDNTGVNSFKKSMTQIHAIWDGVWTKLGSSVGPLLEKVSGWIDGYIGSHIDDIGKVVSSVFGFLQKQFIAIGVSLEIMGEALKPLLDLFPSMNTNLSTLGDALSGLVMYWTAGWIGMKDIVQNIWTSIVHFVGDGFAKVMGWVHDAIEFAASALDDVPGLGKTADKMHSLAKEAWKVGDAVQSWTDDFHYADIGADLDDIKHRMEQAQKAAKNMKGKKDEPEFDARLFDLATKLQEADPFVKWRETSQDLIEAFQKGYIGTLDEFNRAMDKARDDLKSAVGIPSDPLDKYAKSIDQLKRGMASGDLTLEQGALGMLLASEALSSGISQLKNPEMLVEGSKEAIKLIQDNANRGQAKPEERLLNEIQQQKDIQRQHLEAGKALLNFWQQKDPVGVL